MNKIPKSEKEKADIMRCESVVITSPISIHTNAIKHGWWEGKRNIPELLCLIHSEVSEALEGYRDNVQPGAKGWLGEELADVVIRCFDMAEGLDIDIISEIAKKHETNKKRPYRHGGKVC